MPLTEAGIIAALTVLGSIIVAYVGYRTSRAQMRVDVRKTADALFAELCEKQQRRIDQLQQHLERNEDEIERLQAELTRAQCQIAEMVGERERLEGRVSELERENADLKAQIEALQRKRARV